MNARFLFPLRVMIPLLLSGGSLVIAAFSLMYSMSHAITVVEEQARSEFANDMSQLQGIVDYLLQQSDRIGVQTVLSSAASHLYLKHVVLSDQKNEILAATQLVLVGKSLQEVIARLGLQGVECPRQHRVGTIAMHADRSALLACYPIILRARSDELQAVTTGHLLALYDLTELKAEARQSVLRQALYIWLFFVLFVSLVSLLVRHSLARQRIAQVIEAMQHIAAGNLSTRVGLHGRDELATISQSFDRMVEQLQTSNQQLQESEERWRVTHELSLDAFTILRSVRDQHGTIVDFTWEYANPMAATLLRRPLEQLLGHRLLQVLPGNQTRSDLFKSYVEVVETGQPKDREHYYDADGITGWFRNMTVKLGDGVANSFRDITARKHAEEDLRRAHDKLEQRITERTHELLQTNQALRAEIAERQRAEGWRQSLIATSQDAIVSIDRTGKIVEFNAAAELIFGYSKAEIRGCNVSLLMPEPLSREHDSYIQRYEQTGMPHVIGRIRHETGKRKNGEIFPIELSVTEVKTDDQVRYGAFIRDISERVRLQEQLVERERLAAIGTTTAKLLHEVGNPLNSMSVATQLLQRRLERQREVLDDKVFDSVQSLRNEITRLSQLLQDFRARSRRPQLTHGRVDLTALVRELLVAEVPYYAARGIRIEHISPEIPLYVHANADKLKQAFLNLYKNAVEAMSEGGTLTVRVLQSCNQVTVEVVDTGVGIPDGVNIFAPFVTTKAEGTGLGLPIVREIVEAHGGTLNYVSTRGQGTTFTVQLPTASR